MFADLRSLALIGGALLLSLPWSTVPLRSQGEDRIVTTNHQVAVDGKPLRYTARAGHLPIRDNETGEVHGRMFFIAYTTPRRAGRAATPADLSVERRAGLELVARAPARLRPATHRARRIARSTTRARGSTSPTSSSSIRSAPATAVR